MTAPWVSQTVQWPQRVGRGLARSVTLLAVTAPYPVMWVLLGWSVWSEHTRVHGLDLVAMQFTAAGGGLVCFVVAGPITGALRSLVLRWTGITVANGYRPTAPIVRMSTGFWWNGRRYWRFLAQARLNTWLERQLRDPAVRRERRALLAPIPFAVGVVAAVPVACVGVGVAALAGIDSAVRLVGLVPIAVGIGIAPHAWRAAVAILIWLLRPSAAAALSARVARLTAQRADATAAQAAEIRRIERDLHDGAQARLVALGLALTTAERTIDRDLEQAKALLREATATTTTALRELRELVRGITPPVLSERGLTDALRALALDTPLPVVVEADPGFDTRLDVPIESALYFGAAELLTNAVKRAQASRVTIRLGRLRDSLVIEVADDGRGNAAPAERSGGLAGLGRRLAAFDGTLALDSPAGGPTRARMVVPWTSS